MWRQGLALRHSKFWPPWDLQAFPANFSAIFTFFSFFCPRKWPRTSYHLLYVSGFITTATHSVPEHDALSFSYHLSLLWRRPSWHLCLAFCLVLFWLFWDEVPLYSPGWPELYNLPTSAPQAWGSQVWNISSVVSLFYRERHLGREKITVSENTWGETQLDWIPRSKPTLIHYTLTPAHTCIHYITPCPRLPSSFPGGATPLWIHSGNNSGHSSLLPMTL